ncbi:hypothetical protein E4631_02215 [Hymenobacter sp. UV11]|uniref:hypothetical protein n=1 Tax=Hymenobacter sp. UV11 TaxID=1849735 RepID=UPI00105B9D5E|nr:hypothetical protein [Hymenobacter sp. UV11]TDN37696.1 hypothetical protein A8B98_04035 [Hymenobacter sp. UV11]TFZ68897.1 hypothetical protein E4631_02215 [Hymenobacter sp. UV11]
MLRHLYFFFLFLFSTPLPLLAQGNGPAAHGGRAQALGNASATLGGEVWAVANNAAGLGSLTRPTAGAYFENRYLIPSLNVAAVALALPLGVVEPATGGLPARASRGVLGVEAQRFGGILYNEVRVGAAYGYQLGVVRVGGRLDALQVSFQDLGSRRTLAASLGGQADILPQRLTLGVYLYNITQAKLADYQDERVPTVLRAGLAYRPGKQVLLLGEVEKDVERAAGFKAGVEYLPTPAVAVRLGYASLSQQSTAGVGLHAGDWQLDYAAGWHNALGLSQYFSVSWQWEKEIIKNEE